ncbi:hypothetical protein BN1708_014731 [Verticillium longisporum]|uniref:Oxysterol-binding protein n=1 Tax=Verticillium longisporum TaxID=100787 RepID=A0A0G4LYX8_VERLO|nr:hypothetical protein BN1708_014731 [Verticillium longisporum]
MDSKHKSSRIKDLVQFLASTQGDLSNITAPPMFLAPTSVVEVGRCWAEHPAIFAAPALEPDPARRALLATTTLVSEQVSHHPPITAMHVSDTANGIRADGYARVEMSFSGTVDIRQVGHAVLHIDRYAEDYLIPLPAVQVRGFLGGRLYPEITGVYTIPSSGAYVSEIRFSGAGLCWGGRKNGFTAVVFRRDDPRRAPVYSLEGVWSDAWTVRDARGDVLDTFRLDEAHVAPLDMAPLDAQDPWESKRAWRDDYLIPLPAVQVRGFLGGRLYPEMTGVYTIPSSGAYVSQIRFSGAGLCWGGRKNGFTAVVFRRDDPRRAPVYSLEGVWSDAWTVRDARGDVVDTFRLDEATVAPLDMAPLDAQDPWESKRAWRDVAAGLRSGDVRAAVAAKTELERAQREMRAVEADEGRTWAPLLFRSAPGAKHDVFHRLAEGMEGWEHLYDERTKGVWRVDEAALKTQRPFRGELTPLG